MQPDWTTTRHARHSFQDRLQPDSGGTTQFFAAGAPSRNSLTDRHPSSKIQILHLQLLPSHWTHLPTSNTLTCSSLGSLYASFFLLLRTLQREVDHVLYPRIPFGLSLRCEVGRLTFLLQEILRLGYLEGRSTCLALTVSSGGCIKVGSIAGIGAVARQSWWLHLLAFLLFSERSSDTRDTRT